MLNRFNLITEYKYISGVNGNKIKKHKITNRVFPFCVAVYVEEGAFFVEVDNKRYDVSVGEAVFIPSFVPHAVGSDGDSVVTYAHFFCNCMNIDALRFSKSNCLTTKNIYINQLLREMNNYALSGGLTGKLGSDKAICETILTLIQEGALNISCVNIDFRLYKILDYIKQNASNGVTVEEIVEFSGYSKTMFYKIFIDSMNITPHKYIEQERLKQTLFLLSEGKKIKEAAIGGGYYDETYFAKKFKKHFGITPNQYRKIIKEEWR